MNYHNITRDDMLNGDGLRVVLWVSGCEHHCKGCQNPVTWDPQDGVLFDRGGGRRDFQGTGKKAIYPVLLSVAEIPCCLLMNRRSPGWQKRSVTDFRKKRFGFIPVIPGNRWRKKKW